jgi:hypothetical protein
VSIDNRRCLFTADNFFHQDQFSGSGGWMGLNRSYPAAYGESARMVLNLNPQRILAEHGGPYVYDAEDYRRRAKWGAAAAKATNALCLSGVTEWDWNPNRVEFEPHLQTAKPGTKLRGTLRVTNTSTRPQAVTLRTPGRKFVPDFLDTWELQPGRVRELVREFELSPDARPGRHVFEVRSTDAGGVEGCDCYFVVDVVSP